MCFTLDTHKPAAVMRSRLLSRWWHQLLDGNLGLQILNKRARALLPLANFITIHYTYFIITCLVTSLIFWVSSTSFRVSYVDSLFLVISAMTESGLNPVNLSQITTWQQVLLWLLMVIGSTVWVSILTVLARKRAFERRFDVIVQLERDRALRRRENLRALPVVDRILSVRRASSTPPKAYDDHLIPSCGDPAGNHPTRATRSSIGGTTTGTTDSSFDGSTPAAGHVVFASASERAVVSSHQLPYFSSQFARRNPPSSSASGSAAGHGYMYTHWRHILTRKTVGRNAQFHGLSRDERERLGGYEYRALKMLAIIVPLYSFLWQFLGAVALGAWIATNSPEIATSNGVGAWWSGIFYAVSAFNNNGLSLIDLNMIPFQQAYFVLIIMSLLILAGNTAYPIFLRLIFWSMWKILKFTTNDDAFFDTKATLEFVLNYPRRVYTNLFPSRPTWWLLFMLILLNSIDWLLFEVLNIGNPITEAIPIGPRVLDGLFQAIGESHSPTESLEVAPDF